MSLAKIIEGFIVRHWDGLEGFYHGFISDSIKLYTYGTSDMFLHVEVETTTDCNLNCVICPTAHFPRKRSDMDDCLFEKIIDDLSRIPFAGTFSPHGYGEPLMDRSLAGRLRLVSERLPKATIILWTNGTLLSSDKFTELEDAGVSRFIITQYGSSLVAQNLSSKQRSKIRNRILAHSDSLWNRGGLMQVQNPRVRDKCYYPANKLTVDCQGNVILCCNDYHGRHVFGNLREESVMDVWEKDDYAAIRKEIRKGNYELELCRKCTGKA